MLNLLRIFGLSAAMGQQICGFNTKPKRFPGAFYKICQSYCVIKRALSKPEPYFSVISLISAGISLLRIKVNLNNYLLQAVPGYLSVSVGFFLSFFQCKQISIGSNHCCIPLSQHLNGKLSLRYRFGSLANRGK